MSIAIPGVPLSPLVPRHLVWFFALAHPALVTSYLAVLLATGKDVWLDFGLWLALSMVVFVLVRAASRAGARGIAVPAMAAAGALSVTVHRLLMQWLLWQRLRPSSHAAFLWALPSEVVSLLFLASVEALSWSLFAFIVQPRRSGTSVERADWASVGAALWCTGYVLVPPVAFGVLETDPVALLELVLPMAFIAAVVVRIVRRRRWVWFVAQQRVPGWRLVGNVDAASLQLPILFGIDDSTAPMAAALRPTTGVLVRTRAGAQPFRENEQGEPVARVGASRRATRVHQGPCFRPGP